MTTNVIKTDRLVLRTWCEEDLEHFAKMNADPRVMEFFPSVRSFEESKDEFTLIQEGFSSDGWGLWVASLIGSDKFMGFIGIKKIGYQTHFTPAVEIGWRLAYEYWGQGYATEGAKAALEYGFENVKLDEIVAMTAKQNIRSQNVMEKIGMTCNPDDDFDHPKVPEGNWLRRHVLYRIKNGA